MEEARAVGPSQCHQDGHQAEVNLTAVAALAQVAGGKL